MAPAPRKPSLWVFDKSRVAPEWNWFWGEANKVTIPFMENSQPYDYAAKRFPTMVGPDPVVVPSGEGLTYRINDGNSRSQESLELSYLGTDFFDGIGEFTYAFRFKYTGTAVSGNEDTFGMQWSSAQGFSDNDAKRILIRWRSFNNVWSAIVRDSVDADQVLSTFVDDAPKDGEYHSVVWTYSVARNATEIWLDGTRRTTEADYGTLSTNTAHSVVPELFGGNLVTTGGGDSPRIDGSFGTFHKRAWTDAEVLQWFRDPYGPMREDVRRNYFVPAAAGGGVSIPVHMAANRQFWG